MYLQQWLYDKPLNTWPNITAPYIATNLDGGFEVTHVFPNLKRDFQSGMHQIENI